MANEQKPAFIDLNVVFNTYSPSKYDSYGPLKKAAAFVGFMFGYERPYDSKVSGAYTHETTINVNDIKKFEDAAKCGPDQISATYVVTETLGNFTVRETRDEVKQKIAAALKP